MHETPSEKTSADKHGLGELFPVTAWSFIASVAPGDEARTREALEDLCRRYWHPARKFLRSLGCSEHNAEDLTQKFFARWANAENFRKLDREKGRLRSYMKQGLRHTFINEWRHSQTRNPDRFILSTPMGEKYTYDQHVGLLAIEDANSNRLDFTTAGITHSSGPTLSFTRDAVGRITTVTAPGETTWTYAYSTAGDLVSVTDNGLSSANCSLRHRRSVRSEPGWHSSD